MDFPGAGSYPEAYKGVMNEDYIKSLYAGIDYNQAQDVGLAEGQAISRGIVGSGTEAGLVGAANEKANMGRQDALSGFLYNLAGAKQKENQIFQGQQYGVQQQGIQNDWQQGQTELERNLKRAQLADKEKRQNQSDLYGLYGEASGAIGGAAGKLVAMGS